MRKIPVLGHSNGHDRQAGDSKQIRQMDNHNAHWNEPGLVFPWPGEQQHQQNKLQNRLQPGATVIHAYKSIVFKIDHSGIIISADGYMQDMHDKPNALVIDNLGHSLMAYAHLLADRPVICLIGPKTIGKMH